VSTEHGLEQDFNSLDAQREAGRAYVKSQTHEGWRLIKESFDDGVFSGGSLWMRFSAERRSTRSLIVSAAPNATWRTPSRSRSWLRASCAR
jgi:hypothetical protein